MLKKSVPFLLLTALLAGCVSTKTESEESIVTLEEQEAALQKTKAPQQQASYTVYTLQGNLAIKAEPHLHPNHKVELSYLAENAPVVEAQGKSSRTKLNVLIDPSSAVSWAEFNTAQALDAYFLELDGVYIPYPNHLAVGADSFAATVSQLRFDMFFMEDVAFYVRMAKNDLGPFSRGIKEPQVDAVLGYDMLKVFEYIQFDTRGKKLVLSATTPYTPSPGRLVGQARIMNNALSSAVSSGLIVKGAIDGEDMPIMLDFAGNYFFRRGDINTPVTDLVSIGSIAEMDAPTIAGTFSDLMPRVGTRMLEKYLITICPLKGIVYFERPALEIE
ncbi:MAG: hypothetical protein JXR40_04625 [Pontiellaceae bacterium]|nr:hypothetical protein [Pontiellaceae bacterium]